MRKIVFGLFAMLVVVFLLSASAFADQEEPATESTSQEEISALQEEIEELREMVVALQALVVALQASASPERTFSIGVMPIKNSRLLPSRVGESFREMLVSALSRAGINIVESLDDETLRWVRRQDQLVREGILDAHSTPDRGDSFGATHFLLGTVVRFGEEDSSKFFVSKKTVLVVDFRLVDARTGRVISAFQTKGIAEDKIFGGPDRPIESWAEPLARRCAEEAAQKIAGLPGFTTAKPEPKK